MTSLDTIIEIQIDRQTKAVAQKGFGVALILGPVAEKPAGMAERVREYTSETFADDFDSADTVYKMLSAYFSQSLMPEKCLVGFVEGTETVSEALDAIVLENADFYAVILHNTTKADQELVATWVESKRRIAFERSAEAGVLTTGTTDIAASLFALKRTRTAVFYNGAAATAFIDAAIAGRMLPVTPGSATYKFKTLSGIVADKLTGTQRTNVLNKKANIYETVGGVDIIEEGTVASGEFIDVMIGVDFIHARMQEAIYSRLVNLEKIPYTNAGVDIIVNEMDAVLKLAVRNGILSEYTIEKPNVKDIAFNSRAMRVLPDLKFKGTLAGAVHKIQIKGVVTV